MSETARCTGLDREAVAFGMPLRLAQRAFAEIIERRQLSAPDRTTEFDVAKLRAAARRTLANLSADEQTALVRWLALQIAARSVGADDGFDGRSAVQRVDPNLAATLAASVLQACRELGAHRPRGGAVAA